MSRPHIRPPERSTAGGEREKNGSASSALGQSLHEAAIQPRLDGRFFFCEPRRRGVAEDGTEAGVGVGRVRQQHTKARNDEAERARHLSCFRAFRVPLLTLTTPNFALRVPAPPWFKYETRYSHQSAFPRYARRRSSCQIVRELIGSVPLKLSGSAIASAMLVALALALSA